MATEQTTTTNLWHPWPRYYGYDSLIPREVIEETVQRMVAQFKPDKVILFGSYAYGTPTPESDVDLLVIMDTPLKMNRQAIAVRRHVRFPFAVDLLVRTPALIKDQLAIGDLFLKAIIERGVVLYERLD